MFQVLFCGNLLLDDMNVRHECIIGEQNYVDRFGVEEFRDGKFPLEIDGLLN